MNKLYKDTNGNIYSVSPIQQPNDGWVKLTETEVEAHLNPKIPFATAKENKYAEIAAARYNEETSGLNEIATDRDSQALITGAALAAIQDSTYSVNWKTTAGFVTLSAEEILTTAQAVRAHVQSCFDHEAELLPLIEAATSPEELEVIVWSV